MPALHCQGTRELPHPIHWEEPSDQASGFLLLGFRWHPATHTRFIVSTPRRITSGCQGISGTSSGREKIQDQPGELRSRFCKNALTRQTWGGVCAPRVPDSATGLCCWREALIGTPRAPSIPNSRAAGGSGLVQPPGAGGKVGSNHADRPKWMTQFKTSGTIIWSTLGHQFRSQEGTPGKRQTWFSFMDGGLSQRHCLTFAPSFCR